MKARLVHTMDVARPCPEDCARLTYALLIRSLSVPSPLVAIVISSRAGDALPQAVSHAQAHCRLTVVHLHCAAASTLKFNPPGTPFNR